MTRNKVAALFLPMVLILALDQWTKFLVRTSPGLQDWTIIEGWLSFHYTLNPGMALGIDWASTPVISLISITVTIGIFIYLFTIIESANLPFLGCFGLILGGALGNIVDRLFLGVIEGYGGVLDGHVVDFIHFTLEINDFAVFPYIFNVADIAISTSLIIMILFNRKILPAPELESEEGQDLQQDSTLPPPPNGDDDPENTSRATANR